MEREKGFILGACEDGTFYYRGKKNQYTIEIEQKIYEWLEIVKKAFCRVYNKNSNLRKTSKGFYRLTIYSKKIYNELLETRKNYKKVLERSKEYQIGFLQGVFDAEGTVHNKRYSIRVASKKKEVINVIKEILEKLKIKTGKIYKDKTIYVLPLYGKENLIRFLNIIGFRHPQKKKKLLKLIPG